MYKIYWPNKDFTEILNPDSISEENENWTNLEYARYSCVESQINSTIFFQESIPDTNPKFWKKEGNQIVEMTQSEQERVIALENYEIQKEKHKNFRYLLTVDFAYVMQHYQALAFMMLAKQTVMNDVKEGVAYMWFDDFEAPEHRLIVESDSKFILEDLEHFNPDSPV